MNPTYSPVLQSNECEDNAAVWTLRMSVRPNASWQRGRINLLNGGSVSLYHPNAQGLRESLAAWVDRLWSKVALVEIR